MPTVDDLSESSYLAKSDVKTPKLLTIADPGWKKEDVSLDSEPTKMKFVLYFEEEEKGLVLNKTNGNLVANIVGSADFDNWPGNKVVLYNDPNISFAGKIVGGIRIRAPKDQQQQEDVKF